MRRIPLAAGNTIVQVKTFLQFLFFIDYFSYKISFLNNKYSQKNQAFFCFEFMTKSRQNNVMTFFKRKGTSSLHREAIKGTLIYQKGREYKKK